MIKIKSVSDVITNSSTEVWAIRSNILKEARSLFEDESWRHKTFGEQDEKENLYRLFIDLPDMKSLLEAWETPEGKSVLSEFIPEDLKYLLKPYKLTFPEVRILRVFGHTVEELKAYEEKINSSRLTQLKESEEKFKDYLGWSVAVFYDHYRMWGGDEAGKKLRSWLKENHNPDDWSYDY